MLKKQRFLKKRGGKALKTVFFLIRKSGLFILGGRFKNKKKSFTGKGENFQGKILKKTFFVFLKGFQKKKKNLKDFINFIKGGKLLL